MPRTAPTPTGAGSYDPIMVAVLHAAPEASAPQAVAAWLATLRAIYPDDDLDAFEKAFVYARERCGTALGRDGEGLIDRAVGTAAILADLNSMPERSALRCSPAFPAPMLSTRMKSLPFSAPTSSTFATLIDYQLVSLQHASSRFFMTWLDRDFDLLAERLRLHFLKDALFFQEVVEYGTGMYVTFRHVATP